MKKYNILLVIISAVLGFSSCEPDNYAEPGSLLTGKIYDHNGNLYLTTQGQDDMRIRAEEISWSNGDTNVVVTPNHLGVKQDGTYTNTKMFNGTYVLTPENGSFYPVEGDTVTLNGSLEHDFQVTPYLDITWVEVPHFDEFGFIHAKVSFARNALEGQTMPDLKEAQIFVSPTDYCGSNVSYGFLQPSPVTITNDMEGESITISTNGPVRYVGVPYTVRVGLRVDDNYNKYNYSTIETIALPEGTVLPIMPKTVPTAAISYVSLASDVLGDLEPIKWNGGFVSMFDGDPLTKLETSKGDWPQSFTVDLGKAYPIETFKMWPFGRNDFYFKRHSIATFELYKWTGEGEPVDDMANAGWVKIKDYESTKPSGMPSTSEEYDTLTDEDKALCENGLEFSIPEGEGEFQYLRFVITDTFDRTTKYGGDGSDGNRFALSEMQFWYTPAE